MANIYESIPPERIAAYEASAAAEFPNERTDAAIRSMAEAAIHSVEKTLDYEAAGVDDLPLGSADTIAQATIDKVVSGAEQILEEPNGIVEGAERLLDGTLELSDTDKAIMMTHGVAAKRFLTNETDRSFGDMLAEAARNDDTASMIRPENLESEFRQRYLDLTENDE